MILYPNTRICQLIGKILLRTKTIFRQKTSNLAIYYKNFDKFAKISHIHFDIFIY